MSQRNNTVDEFYAKINHQLSLIINKIKSDNYSAETVEALISSHRNRALDVFIRGINGDISKMLAIQKPATLPEAYTSCLEFQNMNYRNTSIHPRNNRHNNVGAPTNQVRSPMNRNGFGTPYRNLSSAEQVRIYNGPIPVRRDQQYTQNDPPPRPTQPKPAIPMEVDPSIRTRQVNYMNRPEKSPPNSGTYSSNIPRKQQRLFNVETVEAYEQPPSQEYETRDEDYEDFCDEPAPDNEQDELNFMIGASLAYPI